MYDGYSVHMFYETDSMQSMQRQLTIALKLPTSTEIDLLRKLDGDRCLKIGDDNYEALDQNKEEARLHEVADKQ